MLRKIFTLPKHVCMALLSIAVAILSVGSVFGYFCNCGQLFELASHFRIVYAVGYFICAAGFLLLRRWKPCIVTLTLFAVCDLLPLAQMFLPPAQASVPDSPNTVTVFHANLWGGKNRNYNKAIDLLMKRKPDVIGLSEVTPRWGSELKKGLSEEYPYQIIEDRFGGVAIFSRYPFTESKIEYFDAKTRKRPRIVAEIDVKGHPLTCILVHPLVPLGSWFKYRNSEFAELANELSQIGGDKILIGDLNCSPWSSYFSDLASRSGLKDSECGFGPQATWPTFAVRPFLPAVPLIPIDHCLTSDSVVTVKRNVGPYIGSDHLPFQVTLALTSLVGDTQKKSTI